MTPTRRRGLAVAAGIVATLGLGVLLVHLRGERFRPLPTGAAGMAAEPGADLPPSLLVFRVELDEEVLQRRLEEVVPRSFGDPEQRFPHPANSRITYAAGAERDALEVRFRGDSLHLSTRLRYAGRVWFASPFGGELTASCGLSGAPRPRATLQLSLALELDSLGALRPGIRSEVEPTSAAPEDRCRVALGPLELDATETLLSTAREALVAQTAALEATIAASTSGESLERAWADLQDPIPLAEGVWLLLRPSALLHDRIETEPGANRASLRVGIEVRPRVVVGRRPEPGSLSLPPPAPASLGREFHLRIEARLEHGEASALLTEALAGREFMVVGRPLRVTGVRITGSEGGRVRVALEIDGAVRGTLHLVGTPTVDQTDGAISIPDLRFSVETRSLLVRSAVWLLQGTLPERTRERARWPLEPAVERALSRTRTALSGRVGGAGRLDGAIHRLEVESVRTLPDAFEVVLSVLGEASLRLEGG